MYNLKIIDSIENQKLLEQGNLLNLGVILND